MVKLYLFLGWLSATGYTAYDLMSSGYLDHRSGDHLAIIQSENARVDIKPIGHLDRYSASHNQKIFGYDMIYSKSKPVQIRLVDGSLIELEPNSQLKILPKESLNNEIAIDLLKGGIQAKKGESNLALGAKSFKISLNTSRGRVLLQESDSSINITRRSGDLLAQIDSSDNVTMDLGETQALLASLGREAKISLQDTKPEVKKKKDPPVIAVVKPKKDYPIPTLIPKIASFWTAKPLVSAIETPLPIRYKYAQKKAPKGWRPAFKVIASRETTELFDSSLKPDDFGVPITRNQISGSRPLIKIEPGYSLDDDNAVYQSSSFTYRISSLQRSAPSQLFFNRHQASKNVPSWFVQKVSSKYSSSISLKDGRLFSKLAPVIVNQAFKMTNGYQEPETGVFLVKSGVIAGYFGGTIPSENQAMWYLNRLDGELVFRGKKRNYLGNKDSFNVSEYLKKNSTLFYVHRGRSIRLDPQLFRTHKTAEDFLKGFDSHFLLGSIEVIARK